MKFIPPIKEYLETKKFNNREKTMFLETYLKFENIPYKKQERIINLLSYCKEIRNTEYPLKHSEIRELELIELCARKEKDLIYITGSLRLSDQEEAENRAFEAYILEESDKIVIYLDVTRLCVDNEPKMIRTRETFVETQDSVLSITSYAGIDGEEKIFSEEFPIPSEFIHPIEQQKVTNK